MLDEGNNDNLETPEAQPPEESNNRTFLIVGGIFAALIFLTLVCGAIYVLYLGPRLHRTKKCCPGHHRGWQCPGYSANDIHSSRCLIYTHIKSHD